MNNKMTKWGAALLMCGALGLFSCKVAEKTPPKKDSDSASVPDKKTPSSKSGEEAGETRPDGKALPKKNTASVVQSEGKNLPLEGNARHEELNKTVRFSFKDVPEICKSGLYFVTEDRKHIHVPALIGLLGASLQLPAGHLLDVYDKAPVDGVPQGNKLFSTTIPIDCGDNVAAVVIPLKNGEYDLVFIDESRLVPGSFYLHNITDESLGMQIDKEQIMVLEPGDREFVTLGFSNNNLHPVKLMRKDDKGKWYVTRQFSLFSRRELTDIIFLMWNEGLNRPDVQKFTVAKENAPEKRAPSHTGS